MDNKIVYENVKPYLEAGKELLRIGMIACIPILIDGLSAGEINWKLVATAGLIAAIKSLDKLLHLEGKVTGDNTLTKGLTQF